MELVHRDQLPREVNYESITGNTDAPWYARKKILLGITLAILLAVIVTIAVALSPSRENSSNTIEDLPPLQWIDDCPKNAPTCPSSFEGRPPLLLLSLDGFRPDYLDRGLTPTLTRLSRCGTRAEFMLPVFPSKTFPNHFSQVTGLYPSSHGIIDNFMFDPRTGRTFKLGTAEAMDPAWWEREPVWVSAEKQGKRTATFFWPGSDVRINGTLPTHYRAYDTSVPFEERVDQVMRWLDLPPSERPSLLTLYVHEPDATSHQHGTDAQQTHEALSRVDKVVERLFAGLQVRNLTDCVNIFIMSDHGMANLDCSRIVNIGEYVDVSQVRVTDGSFGRLQVKDGTNATLESVEAELRCRSDHMRVYSKEELPVRAHYAAHPRIEPVFLDMDSGWALLRKTAEVNDYKCTGGNHGYDHLFPDMRATFIAVGPSVKRNTTVKPFINTELYEMMCEMIDIIPNPNNGTRGSLHHLLKAPRRPLSDVEEPHPPAAGMAGTGDPRAAECPCPQPGGREDADLSERTAFHLPFGTPHSATDNDTLLVLPNTDYVLAYSTTHRMAAWVGFTLLKNLPPGTSDVCWSGDGRVADNDTVKCHDYDSQFFEEQHILQRPLYPPGLSVWNTRQEAYFVTNSVPKSLNHTVLLEAAVEGVMRRWVSEKGPLHVLLGPAFDLLANGIQPDSVAFERERAKHSSLIAPTHLFLVCTWCAGRVDRLSECEPSLLDTVSFLLPNHPFPDNCEAAESILQKNVARVVDIEKLTGLSLFRGLPIYEAVRLRTSLPSPIS